jgi:hypothetical protein
MPKAKRPSSWRICAVLFVSAAIDLTACASAPAPVRLRLAEVGSRGGLVFDGRTPVIVELAPGDRLPVQFTFASDDFALEPTHPEMVLVATRRCFVRLAADGVRVSSDGVTFDAKPRQPGSFRAGLSVTKDAAPHIEVAIQAPHR